MCGRLCACGNLKYCARFIRVSISSRSGVSRKADHADPTGGNVTLDTKQSRAVGY